MLFYTKVFALLTVPCNTGWGRKTYHISKPYDGNAVSVIHVVGVNLGRNRVAIWPRKEKLYIKLFKFFKSVYLA